MMDRTDMDRFGQILTALDILPADKREYIVGYAEGVIAMSERYRAEQAAPVQH